MCVWQNILTIILIQSNETLPLLFVSHALWQAPGVCLQTSQNVKAYDRFDTWNCKQSSRTVTDKAGVCINTLLRVQNLIHDFLLLSHCCYYCGDSIFLIKWRKCLSPCWLFLVLCIFVGFLFSCFCCKQLIRNCRIA